jgi:hypothetical protein
VRIARRIEHTGHPNHRFFGKTRFLERHLRHRVERVGDDDQDRVRRLTDDLFGHARDDFPRWY